MNVSCPTRYLSILVLQLPCRSEDKDRFNLFPTGDKERFLIRFGDRSDIKAITLFSGTSGIQCLISSLSKIGRIPSSVKR